MCFFFRVTKKEKRPPLRQYLMDGDFFIGAALSATLTKLGIRFVDLETDLVSKIRLNYQSNDVKK